MILSRCGGISEKLHHAEALAGSLPEAGLVSEEQKLGRSFTHECALVGAQVGAVKRKQPRPRPKGGDLQFAGYWGILESLELALKVLCKNAAESGVVRRKENFTGGWIALLDLSRRNQDGGERADPKGGPSWKSFRQKLGAGNRERVPAQAYLGFFPEALHKRLYDRRQRRAYVPGQGRLQNQSLRRGAKPFPKKPGKGIQLVSVAFGDKAFFVQVVP